MRLNSTFVSYAAEFSLLTIVTFQKEIKRVIGHMQISSDARVSDLPLKVSVRSVTLISQQSSESVTSVYKT